MSPWISYELPSSNALRWLVQLRRVPSHNAVTFSSSRSLGLGRAHAGRPSSYRRQQWLRPIDGDFSPRSGPLSPVDQAQLVSGRNRDSALRATGAQYRDSQCLPWAARSARQQLRQPAW